MPRTLPVEEGVAEAVRVIRAGGLVAVPTDTVYGIAADAGDTRAVRKLYEAKGRDADTPIPLLLADASDVTRVAGSLTPVVERLAAAFWPGPLTLVVSLGAPGGQTFPAELTAGRSTVGARAPDHRGLRSVIEGCGGWLAVTSANHSGGTPATCVEEVVAALGEFVDLVLDGGSTPGPVPSTVLDVAADPPRILREGVLSASALAPYLRQTQAV